MGEKISWESEFTTALNRAKAEGKRSLLSFHNPRLNRLPTDGCGYVS